MKIKINPKTINKQVDKINMRNAKNLDTKLGEADYFLGCCPECAKYRGRIFSITGKDKRFPKKPAKYGCTCQGLTFSPFIYGVDEPMHYPKGVDIISYSNRPFVDDRSDSEKETYQHYLDCKIFESIKQQDRKDYDKLKKTLPSETPKTFSAYRRMKISETSNFLKIAEKAHDLGINIRLSNEDKIVLERYNNYEKVKKENNSTVNDISYQYSTTNSIFESLKQTLKKILAL